MSRIKEIIGQIKNLPFFGKKDETKDGENIMYLIVGLGNPGKQYDMTRHNIGFHTIDYIADKYGARLTKLKFKALYGEAKIGGERVYLVKPQTYMNLSGDSVYEMSYFYKIPPHLPRHGQNTRAREGQRGRTQRT